MRRLVAAAVVLTAAVGASTAGFGAPGVTPGFQQGVAAGEITPTRVLLWTRAPRTGAVRVELAANARFRAPVVRRGTARAIADRTIRVQIASLRPGTRYWYRFRQGNVVSPVGTFVTAPSPGAAARVRFAVSGDADATPGADGKPAFNRFETYAQMARERNEFNINLGDTIYSDSSVGGAPIARTAAQKWAKYRLGLALPALRTLRAGAGLYTHWDDHEFVNDFSRAEHGDAIYRAGVKAFTDYAPVLYRTRTGLYRSFRWGRNLELFFLDERSFRSAKATAHCGGDLAPTAPAAIRAALAPIASSLGKPISPACIRAIADPGRTMLGAAQEAAFVRAIRASTATFKVVVNEVPLMQLYALPYDRWEGYAAARTRVLDALERVSGVVVLTTDTHAHLIGEVRRATLEASGAVGTGIHEVVTGPVATTTYAREIDGFLGAPGASAFLTALFFKPAPPGGLGLACAATDTYGYAQVVVTGSRLTVTPKTSAGGRVVDATGRPCAPLVVRPT
jgi:alkaline phosphatase D